MRILVADDEKALADVISKRLKKESYAVDTVYNGADAYDYLSSTDYDLCILDIMMPRLNGVEVLEKYRRSGGRAAVIFLTAKDALEDRVNGLDSGADDYLVKPFSFDELLARIRSILRRTHGDNSPNTILQIDNLRLDLNSGIVKRGDRTIDLSGKEFSMLKYMMSNAGIILSRAQLIEHVWAYDYEGSSNMVDVYIRYLRRKIDTEGEKELIHTFRGRGYMIGDSDES